MYKSVLGILELAVVIPRDDLCNLCGVRSANFAVLELVEGNVDTGAEEPCCTDLFTRLEDLGEKGGRDIP